jgi:hypothetical protein
MEEKDKKVVERMEDGVSLKLKMKRGTETRDQDEIYGKINKESVEDVEEEADEMIELMEDCMKDMREVQPDDE